MSALLLLGLGLRLVFVAALPTIPVSDFRGILNLALDIRNSSWTVPGSHWNFFSPGLPILLSVVYVEAARRAGIELAGVGLPGHYVVGHFGPADPLLVDPFAGGARLEVGNAAEVSPWGAHQTAVRMLNNLVGSYQRRHDLTRAIRAAELRLELPLADGHAAAFTAQLQALRAVLN